MSGVSGRCVAYGSELLICRPSRKQLSWQILSRKLTFSSCISWGNYALKQIYIFWKGPQIEADRTYNLQTRPLIWRPSENNTEKGYIAINELLHSHVIWRQAHLNEIEVPNKVWRKGK